MKNILDYNIELLPAQNIEAFADEVKISTYELFEHDFDGFKELYLQNIWKNDVHLRNIIRYFHKEFQEHLNNLSINQTDEFNYENHLEECKIILNNILQEFAPSYQYVLIFSRIGLDADKPSEQISYNSLSAELQEQIIICNELLQKFFESLKKIIDDEILYCVRVASIENSKSSFIWDKSKVDFSELILLLTNTNSLKMKDGSGINKSKLIRELAALFGIEKIGYNQDIDKVLHKYQNNKEDTLLHQGTIQIIERARHKYKL